MQRMARLQGVSLKLARGLWGRPEALTSDRSCASAPATPPALEPVSEEAVRARGLALAQRILALRSGALSSVFSGLLVAPGQSRRQSLAAL